MLIKWLGHSSFLITSRDKIKIITDPYNTGNGVNYRPLNESAGVVTRSHGHQDHSNTTIIKGNPAVISEPGTKTVQGIEFKAIPVFHDGSQGTQRGKNLIIRFQVDGLTLCHAGDLGHLLSPQQIAEIGAIDILLLPVGGYYTIDAGEAAEVVHSLKPKMVFPMHYRNAKLDFPVTGVEEFLKSGFKTRRINSSEIEIKQETLPPETEIIVLNPAY